MQRLRPVRVATAITGSVQLGFVPVILPILGSAVRVVQEYERGVIFRLGRVIGAKGPGLFFIIPIVDRMVRIDLRVVTISVSASTDHLGCSPCPGTAPRSVGAAP